MTMIISAHLGDCILIAADKRAMMCDLETGAMRLSHDDEQKIKLWCRGAIVGSGDTVFIDRIAQYFINVQRMIASSDKWMSFMMKLKTDFRGCP